LRASSDARSAPSSQFGQLPPRRALGHDIGERVRAGDRDDDVGAQVVNELRDAQIPEVDLHGPCGRTRGRIGGGMTATAEQP
jgi:hypothetical protein